MLVSESRTRRVLSKAPSYGSGAYALPPFSSAPAVALVGILGLAILHACGEQPEPTAPAQVTAAAVVRKTLTIKGGGGTGTGVVTSTPAGINCKVTAGVAGSTGCTAQFNRGVVVTLTPTTQLGHAFKTWSNACTGSGSCQVSMTVNRTVAARFIKGSLIIKIASGATGPGASWEAYGVDGNQDGMMDPYNPVDAIFAAARYLKAAGADHDIRAAVFAYNHADWYVDSVLLRAQVIGGLPSNLVGSLTGLTEGRFPVAAKATYADEVSKKSLRSKRVTLQSRLRVRRTVAGSPSSPTPAPRSSR